MSHTLNRYFPHERLVAYRLAKAAAVFVDVRKARLRKLMGGCGPQLERAVVGALTNLCAGALAEGAERRRHFKIALSEAGEAGGAAELAHALGGFSAMEHDELRAILLRLCACLHGLTRSHDVP